MSVTDIAKNVGCRVQLVYMVKSRSGLAVKRGRGRPRTVVPDVDTDARPREDNGRRRMTATEPVPQTISATSAWDQEFANLKSRFPKAKDSIVFCLHVLQQNPDIEVDDLKARADMHGVRVTAASVAAARRLLVPTTVAAPTPGIAKITIVSPTAPKIGTALQPSRRGAHSAEAVGAEALVRSIVGRMQEQSSAEAVRLREAIRKAIAVLNG
ncbi:MAG: hypothetical protein ABIS67_05890, partial [Candidatus Eisenbacteria bacterium]